MNPGGPAPVRRRRIAILALGCAGMLVYAVSCQILPALLGSVAREFACDFAQRGLLLGVPAGGFVASTLLAGWLSDRWSARPFILTGFVATAAGLGLVAGSNAYGALLCGVLLIGAGGGCLESPLSVLVSDVFPERSAQALNLTQMFFTVGAVAGPIAVSFVVAQGFGWRGGFALGAALAVVAAVYAGWAIASAARDAAATDASRSDAPIAWGPVCALAAAMFLYVGGEMTFAQWGPNYVEETHHADPAWAARVLSGFWLGMMAGRAVYIALVRRMGHVTPILASAALAVAGGLLMIRARTAWGAGAACAATGFVLGGTWPTLLSYAGSKAPHRTGVVFAVMVAVGAMGMLIVPPLAGRLAQTFNWGLRTVLLTAVVSVAAEGLVVLGLTLWEKRRKSAA